MSLQRDSDLMLPYLNESWVETSL